MTHPSQGQKDEDPAFDEDRRQRKPIGDKSGAVDADDLVGEVGVQSHARAAVASAVPGIPNLQGASDIDLRQADRQVGQESKEDGGSARHCAGRSDKVELDNFDVSRQQSDSGRWAFNRSYHSCMRQTQPGWYKRSQTHCCRGTHTCRRCRREWMTARGVSRESLIVPLKDSHVDSNDVCHGRKGGEASADLGHEVGIGNLVALAQVTG